MKKLHDVIRRKDLRLRNQHNQLAIFGELKAWLKTVDVNALNVSATAGRRGNPQKRSAEAQEAAEARAGLRSQDRTQRPAPQRPEPEPSPGTDSDEEQVWEFR
jgi:hypothetical protein